MPLSAAIPWIQFDAARAMRRGRCSGFAKLIDARSFQSIVFTINLLQHFTLMRTGFGVWQNGLQTGLNSCIAAPDQASTATRRQAQGLHVGGLASDPFRIMVSQSMLADMPRISNSSNMQRPCR